MAVDNDMTDGVDEHVGEGPHINLNISLFLNDRKNNNKKVVLFIYTKHN